ncbi:MAG: DUF2220 family protein [Mariprofundus sp.]|nr:DUF2220 family protein [Mariprofundus sp.]
MKWTSTAELKARLQRYWNQGELCRAAVSESDLLPLRLPLRVPTAKLMLTSFAELQDWVKLIRHFAEREGLTLEWKGFNHRNLGQQQLPTALLITTVAEAVAVIGKRHDLKRFCTLYRQTVVRLPSLTPWLLKRPLKLLEVEESWARLLAVCEWMQVHPNPRIYLRQVSLPGIDSKFIESHRLVLGELFELLLPVYAINDDFTGVAGFAGRYGFKDKPLQLRLRPLDAGIRLLACGDDQDIIITAKAWRQMRPVVKRVFITENEVNYLAFPDHDESLLIFGAGYGFDALAQAAAWLQGCEVYYWGDIDTHGFAILDQLRAHIPHARSLLMDRSTLLAHREQWIEEPRPQLRDLPRLTLEEAALYDALRHNSLGQQVRLEQESILYTHLQRALACI